MSLFLVPRRFPPDMSEEAREVLMVQVICAGTWIRNVNWQRSYYVEEPDRLDSWCVYGALSKSEVVRYTEHCGSPFEDVIEVEHRLPGSDVGLLSRDISAFNTPAREDDHYFLVQRTFAEGTPEVEIGASFMRSGQCAAEIPRLYWVRSYWSEQAKKSWCVFRSPDVELVARHSERSVIPCDSVDLVGENHPVNWSHVYDMVGLPRHWEADPSPASVPSP